MASDSRTARCEGGEKTIPHLREPPIEEVVCGVVFKPVPGLDAMVQGVYWDSVLGRFPNKQLQPVLLEGGGSMFVQGVAPLRSWLISKSEDFLIQIQQDRFYMNWRKRSAAYPRFRDRDDQEGLCTQALREFELFSKFIVKRLDTEIEVSRVELQKQDVLRRPKHWQDLADLATIFPVMDTFAGIHTTEHASLNLRMAESDKLGVTTLQIGTRVDAQRRPDAIQIDFHCSAPLADGGLEPAFHAANDRVNRMFLGLFAPAAWPRFGGS